ncbi:MAG: SdpI family protein [Verrucomicrobiae bacterium]
MKILRILKSQLLQVLILAIPFILAGVFWTGFPGRVATHWGLSGRPDSWMGKEAGLLLLPLVNLGIWALFMCLPWLDPKIRLNVGGYERTLAVLKIWRLATTAFLCFLSLLVLAVAGGIPVDMNRAVFNGVLILFLALGNFLGNLRPNYFAGIRTPWTLDDSEIWRATHRVGGRIMVYGALLLLPGQLFLNSEQLMKVFLAYILGFAAWSMGYSYYLFLRKSR